LCILSLNHKIFYSSQTLQRNILLVDKYVGTKIPKMLYAYGMLLLCLHKGKYFPKLKRFLKTQMSRLKKEIENSGLLILHRIW